jgi:predicted GNAT family acetyltransferase
MIEQLNNPVWSALNSGNQNIAIGSEKAKYFQQNISLFAATAENNGEHFRALAEIIPENETVAIFTIDKNLDAAPWNIVKQIDGFQMMYEGEEPDVKDNAAIISLSEKNVPAMLELTRLSPPGPFLKDTIRFGGYEGIFNGNQLVAMAGRRFHNGPYVEINAVCTHPEHTGKGYARKLINNQILQLKNAGMLPYLHVRKDNTHAWEIYQRMGFVIRTDMMMCFLKR